MEKKVISFLGGLNKDDNGLNFPEGDYKSAENIIIETDEEGNGVAIKKMNSTKELSSNIATHFQSSEYVQSCVDLDNSIYVLLKGKYNTIATPSEPVSVLINAATIVKLTKGPTGFFEVIRVIRNYDYQGCTIEPDMCIVGDRLIWNFMGEGVPMMIQTSLTNSSPTPQELTLIKAPPVLQLKVTEISGDSYSIFTNHVYQFAARYIYNDGEASVLGPISPLFGGVDLIEKITINLNENEVKPQKAIKEGKVEYYVREGNRGVWFLIDSIKLNEPNTSLVYDGIKSLALPSPISSKQFDFVPYATKNIEAVNNLIFLGNNKETLPLEGVKSTVTTTDLDFSPMNGSVTKINLTNTGLYSGAAPSITISGGGGSGATASPVLGTVGGSGYSSTPTVSATNGFMNNNPSLTAVVTNGSVSSITVNSGGLYPSNVTPVITISGGGGSGAIAIPVMAVGLLSTFHSISSIVILRPLSSVTITNGGSGFRFTPTVSIATSPYGSATGIAEFADANYDGTLYSYYKKINADQTSYSNNPDTPYSVGFNTDLEEETKPFANGSVYEVGYLLFDEYMRTRGVESVAKFETSNFAFNKYNLSISKQVSFPSWVKYFQVAITKNLTKDFTYEGYASTCYFIAETSNDINLSEISTTVDNRTEIQLLVDEFLTLEPSTRDNPELREVNSARGQEIRDILVKEHNTTIEDSISIRFNDPNLSVVSYEKNRPKSSLTSNVKTPVPFIPSQNQKASDIKDKIKYFAVDISGMFEAERYYTFQVGDEIIGNFDNDTDNSNLKTLRILAQDGSILLCDPSPIINTTKLNSVERSLYFEIYSPADVNQSSVFYANRDVYPISELIGSGEDKTISLQGDCYYNSVSLPSYGHSKFIKESNIYKSESTDAAISLDIITNNDVNMVAKSILTKRHEPIEDVAPELWELDLGSSGDVIINADGLYTIEYSARYDMHYNHTSNGVTRIAETIQVGLLINGSSVRYGDFQNFTTSATSLSKFSSTCSVYLNAGDSVSISHQKSDELLDVNSAPYGNAVAGAGGYPYYINGSDYKLEISKDAIASSKNLIYKKYRRGDKVFVDGGISYTPPEKNFIIKSLSRSGKIETQWNKDYGKPFTKYTEPSRSDFIKNRVRYSGRYIDGGSSSLLSSFLFDDFSDLPVEISSINALKRTSDQQSNGTVVLAMGDRDTFSLYIDRSMVSTAAGQSLTTQSNKVIGQIYPLKGGFGCKDKMSIVRKEGKVFYYDRTEKEYVRYAREGLEPISKKMRNYFKDKTSVKAAYYDPFYDMIFVNFNNLTTAAYSDKLKRWISEYDMAFTGSFYLDNNAYLFSKTDDNLTKLYETRTGTDYGNFLGVETVSKIKLTSNSILPVNVGHIQIKTKNWLDFTSI